MVCVHMHVMSLAKFNSNLMFMSPLKIYLKFKSCTNYWRKLYKIPNSHYSLSLIQQILKLMTQHILYDTFTSHCLIQTLHAAASQDEKILSTIYSLSLQFFLGSVSIRFLNLSRHNLYFLP